MSLPYVYVYKYSTGFKYEYILKGFELMIYSLFMTTYCTLDAYFCIFIIFYFLLFYFT